MSHRLSVGSTSCRQIVVHFFFLCLVQPVNGKSNLEPVCGTGMVVGLDEADRHDNIKSDKVVTTYRSSHAHFINSLTHSLFHDSALVSSISITAAKRMGMPDGSYVVMKLELGSLQSVRDFVGNLKAFKSARPLNHLICNAAVYKPTDPEPAWTDDGFEMTMVCMIVMDVIVFVFNVIYK